MSTISCERRGAHLLFEYMIFYYMIDLDRDDEYHYNMKVWILSS